MRTYGRVYNPDGSYTWVTVTTDANGDNDEVYLVTLAQCLKLGLGESPIYANYGIPAQQSVITQIFPDFYSNQTVNQFRAYFASLSLQKVSAQDENGVTYPAYLVTAVTNQGATIPMVIPT